VVVEETVEDGVADLIGILGLGSDAGGLGAEGLTAGAGGALLGGGEVDDDDGLVGEAADGPVTELLAASGGAAAGARSGRGGVAAVLVAEGSVRGKHGRPQLGGGGCATLQCGADLTLKASGL